MKTGLIVILVVIVVLLLTCIGGAVVGGVWLASNAGPPRGITVAVEQPAQIKVGDEFDLVVTINNTLPEQRRLVDIDFYEPLLDGVTVISTDPAFDALDSTFGFATYSFNDSIPASGAATVTFKLRADAPGTYIADLDVSVDSMFKLATTSHTIAISQ